MRIAIIDAVCPKPYTLNTLKEGTLGGTEATVIRLARELSKRDTVYLLQRDRTEKIVEGNITYIPNGELPKDAHACITLRDGGMYRTVSQEYPNMAHYLWMHDVIGGKYLEHLVSMLIGVKTNFIVGSSWQASQLIGAFGTKFDPRLWSVRVVHNFIEDYCNRSFKPYDPYQLMFISSPHKGLDHVLTLFNKLRQKDSRYHLKIANPGYFKSHEDIPEGVENLGIVKHQELMQHLERSLCLFYPNTTFPETFGLVYAEANSLGVPVLAHDIGAASEVVSTPQQIVDCNNHELVVDTIMRWSGGERPVVKARESYTIREVIKEWRKLLNPMRLISDSHQSS